MHTRNIFPAFCLTIIFSVVVAALLAKSNMDVQNATRVGTQAAPIQDGASLINSRCARCHTVEWIKHIDQPRAEWEHTLEYMEKMGVSLSDDEKIVLIDYLIETDEP